MIEFDLYSIKDFFLYIRVNEIQIWQQQKHTGTNTLQRSIHTHKNTQSMQSIHPLVDMYAGMTTHKKCVMLYRKKSTSFITAEGDDSSPLTDACMKFTQFQNRNK